MIGNNDRYLDEPLEELGLLRSLLDSYSKQLVKYSHYVRTNYRWLLTA